MASDDTTSTKAKAWTAKDLKAALKQMGLRQCDLAWMMGVTNRQAHRWTRGIAPVPRAAKLLLTAMRQERISARWFRRHIETPIPYNSSEANSRRL